MAKWIGTLLLLMALGIGMGTGIGPIAIALFSLGMAIMLINADSAGQRKKRQIREEKIKLVKDLEKLLERKGKGSPHAKQLQETIDHMYSELFQDGIEYSDKIKKAYLERN